MSCFNNNYRLKGLLLITSFSILSSCSTFQTPGESETKSVAQDSITVKSSDLEQKKLINSSNNTALVSSDIIDPMANIQINTEIKKAYKQAASFIKRKQYSNALNLMITIKAKYPQLSGSNYQMARIYLLQKQHDKALEQVNISLQKNPRNYYSMSLKGVILKAQGKFTEAKSTYLKAIEIFPSYSKSHLNLGVLADIYLGDLNLALREYNTYMKLTSNKDKKVANWVLEVERRIKSL